MITTIPSADRQKATVKVRIGFEQLDPRILPDMGVKVSFLTTSRHRPPMRRRAPRTLAAEGGGPERSTGTTVVFVVNDDRVERRAIKVGTRRTAIRSKCSRASPPASGWSSTARDA